MRRTLRFDAFEVDLATHRLFKRGARIRLRDQSFQILVLLLEHIGEVVTREELRRRLWAGVFVDFENSLNTAVGRLREALGDSADHPLYIETVPRLGYRFIGTVTGGPLLPPEPTVPRTKARLMVLPFVNSSGDPSLEYFSDAVTDEIITELSALVSVDVGVIARTTAMHYKHTAKKIGDIASELALDWVVEGSVRRADDHVTLTAQLIRASDQTHVLARRYDGNLNGIFDLERTIASVVGNQIGLLLDGEGRSSAAATEARPRRIPTRDPVAYNSYILGRQSFERSGSPQGWAQGRSLLEAAIARDPQFALAHDALAELWWIGGFLAVVPPTETLAVGMSHALRAVELDGCLASAHAILAQYRKQVAFDWREVDREMTLAIDLDPASPDVRRRHAITGLMPHGRLGEAIQELEFACDRDPLGLYSRIWLATMLWLDRQYDRGIEQCRLLLEIEPNQPDSHFVMGLVCREAGRYEEGVSALRRAAEMSGGSPMMLGWLGLALAESGDETGARALLARFRTMLPRVYVPPTSLAFIHIGLGEVGEFFEWMNKAIDARDHMITPIKSYPFMDPVRGDPRYLDLLRRMNLLTTSG
jgi:TolB-like protein/DNA-binding winged helix-turn-helix (wHTH) protein/tetratricopeptide (TPR) repeat protein